jgi:hypothetical protein
MDENTLTPERIREIIDGLIEHGVIKKACYNDTGLKALGELLDVSRQTVSSWVSGRHRITPEHADELLRLAEHHNL